MTDLAHDGAGFAAGDPPAASSGSPVAGWEKGTCRTCGAPARKPGAYYCEEHAPAPRARNRPKSGRGGGPHRAPRAPRAPAEPDRRPVSELADDVREAYLLAADLLEGANPASSVPDSIRANADRIARRWEGLAARNERTRRVLEGLTSGGGWVGVVAVHAPLLRALLRDRAAAIQAGPLPPAPAGVPTTPEGIPSWGAWWDMLTPEQQTEELAGWYSMPAEQRDQIVVMSAAAGAPVPDAFTQPPPLS